MPSIEEIHRQLGLLSRISSLTQHPPELERLLKDSRFEQAQELVAGRFEQIQLLIGEGSEGAASTLWEPLERHLTDDEYLLSPELEEIHPKIMREIGSKKMIENLPSSGLMLVGSTGTGKSNYVFYLAEQLKDAAKFVLINIDRIAGSESPATVVRTIFKDLDARAKEEGIMYVPVLEEFERLVTKHSTLHSAVDIRNTSHATAIAHHTQRRRQTQETLELDDVGQQTFSMLKTLISGGENIQRVYPIATTNQTAFDPALERRLRCIELKVFGMPEFNFGQIRDHVGAPDYSFYRQAIPRVVGILQRTYYRDKGKRSSALDRIGNELGEVIQGLNQYTASDEIFRDRPRYLYEWAVRNNAYLEALIKYFGVDLRKNLMPSEGGSIRDYRTVLKFAGYFKPATDKIGNLERVAFFNYNEATSPEVKLMKGLTPDTIAKWYREDPEQFSSYAKAKRHLGRILFPQLIAWEEYKEK